MSSTFNVNTFAPVKTFRGVNGQQINLRERSDADGYKKQQSRVIEFELRSESQPANFRVDILILLAVVLLWNTISHQLIISVITVLYALLRCKSILSFVRTDTLLVVESVGIQIIRKRALSYFESTIYLPWNTVKDVFINEVITGNRILYFLTFIVRDTSCGKDNTKLVPLFRDLKPERKCLEYIYHRSCRDSKEFNHGKELMKVIRRIIKSQPRQGQQFGTHHLLVTYNHSSWTRQDKMFAMLKFRDRTDANAFPRAFILTVKLNVSNSSSNNVDEYEDELIIYNKDTDNSRWNVSGDRNTNVNANRVSEDKQHLSAITTDETSSDSSTRVTSVNSTNMRITSRLPAVNSTKCNDRGKKINSSSLFADLDDLPLLERYLLEQQDPTDKPQKSLASPPPSPPSPPPLPLPSSTHQERLNEMQETVDMPYQYLIEREIERTKKHSTNNLNKQQDSVINETVDKLSLENTSGVVSLPRNRKNSTNTIDNATARSANITDLVMEGLMFTIRQDQDTITVMEQKTKLEPDEVLENSEKAETKEGGECLVNSCLLKLENLITKIERSSSAIKAVPRCSEDYKSALSTSPFYAVSGNSTDRQTFSHKSHNIRNDVPPSINLGIFECNKSEGNAFITPKALKQTFNNHNGESDIFVPPLNEIIMNDVDNDDNGTVNSDNNLNFVDGASDNIEEPMEESKIDEHILTKHSEKPYVQLNCPIDIESDKCDNDKGKREKEDIAPEIPEKVKTIDGPIDSAFPKIESLETNLLMNGLGCGESPSTPGANISRSKLKVPRIISNEIVKYDLSSLRSSRLRRRLDMNEDIDNTTNNEDINKETLSNISIPYQKESPQSNEEKVDNGNVTNRRRLTARRRLHGQKNDEDVAETTIEMWKFVQDMTHGVRVVLQRLDLSSISGGIGKNC